MKKETITQPIIAALILIVASLTAAPRHNPEGEATHPDSDPETAAFTLYFCPGVSAVCREWAEAYQKQSPGTAITLHALPVPGQPAGSDVREAIALVESGYLNERKMENHRALRVGREIFVPLVQKAHPVSGNLLKTGILPEDLESGSVQLEEGSLDVRVLDNREEFHTYCVSAASPVALCRLPAAIDPETGELSEEVKLIPVDRNRNGEIDPAEDFYEPVRQLERAVWLGKYPRELYSILYAMLPDRPLEQAEMNFLSWMITDGQSQLASMGYSEILQSELYGLKQKLAGPPPPPLNIPVKTTPSTGPYIVPLILFLILLVVITTLLILKRFGWSAERGHAPAARSTERARHHIPEGLYYDRSHTWAFMEKDGSVRLGLDHFIQELTGPLTRILPAETGTALRKGEAFLTLVQNGKKLHIQSPVSGTVLALNPQLTEDPSVVYRDPYEEGWICTLEPVKWSQEIKAMFMAPRYRRWVLREITRVKDFFTTGIALGRVPEVRVMQEGGELVPGILKDMGPEAWEEFQIRIIENRDTLRGNTDQ